MNDNLEEKRSNIAIVAFSNIATDARVLRQVEYLSNDFPVSVIGYGSLPVMKNVRMYTVDKPNLPVGLSTPKKIYRRLRNRQIGPYIQLMLGRIFPKKAYEDWYWSHPEYKQAYQYLLAASPGLIHANDWTSLPAAVRAARVTGARVIADLHEYAPLEMDGILWHLFLRPLREYVIRRYIPFTVATITVNKTIADKYQDVFGFSPMVVMNTPKLLTEISFRSTDPNTIHLIHHGGALVDRKLELMIETIQFADNRYHLDFMLLGNESYISKLKQIAQQCVPGRVTFHDPVLPGEITRLIAKFDVGIFLLPPSNFNWLSALPNKFFDFIHAGLGVCIGPSPEMSRLCTEYNLGITAPSFEPRKVAFVLNQLTAGDIDRFKHNSLKARQYLNSDIELQKLTMLYHKLILAQ